MPFELLDVRDLKLGRDESGVLRMGYRGEDRKLSRVVRNFPKTNPERFLSLMDEEGHEVGIVEDPEALDADSKGVIKDALREAYFIPTIQAILSIRVDGDASSWEVDTDDGPRSFKVKTREDLSTYDIPSIVVTDAQSKKYRIEDYDDLDPDSQAMLKELLPREIVRLGKTYRKMARAMQGSRGGSGGRL